MPDIIKQLPDHVANQIAAGEVVQRPASVVKELLENAIDAGATRIDLIFREGGKNLIQITDNGCGMSPGDAVMAFERHATSKINKADDLFNLHTKGFRGEALASIAAISHVEVKTRADNDEIGTRVRVEGGKLTERAPEVAPKGTTIAVKNLFYNIPARRNFLKSNTVETRHIIDEFHRVALAHPQLAFTATHNDNLLFNLPSTNTRQRIVNIFGKKTNEKLVPVSEVTHIVKVSGFILKPEYSKKSRGEQFFFVNDRYIRSSYLHHALVAGFEGLLKDGLLPGYFLYLEVDPTTIDINIHPTKTEVKFENEHSIYAMLRSVVKHALGQFSIGPILDFEKDSSLETSYGDNHRAPVNPKIEVDRTFNPFASDERKSYGGLASRKDAAASWEALYVGVSEASDSLGQDSSLSEISIESEEVDGRLFLEKREDKPDKLFFQLQNKYIVSPVKGGMLVVNQNLAHRRILYEQLLVNLSGQQATPQPLLFPIDLQFAKSDITLLEDLSEQLRIIGFAVEFNSGDAVRITAIPQGIDHGILPDLFSRLLVDLKGNIPGAAIEINEFLARKLAKSMAVKNGKALSVSEQENMLDQLFSCNEPALSPENRPVLIRLEAKDLDKRFNR